MPRVGLQSLRLSDELANSLTTEADLNSALGMPQDKAIDDESPAASEEVAEDTTPPPPDGPAAEGSSPPALQTMVQDKASPAPATPPSPEPTAEDSQTLGRPGGATCSPRHWECLCRM